MEVLRRIRLQPLSTRVIVLTNYSQPQYQKKCLELGADYFLDKTKDISVLEELLTQLAGTFKNDRGNKIVSAKNRQEDAADNRLIQNDQNK